MKQAAKQEDSAFEQRILEMHSRQPLRTPLPVLLTTSMIAGIAARYTQLWIVLGWLALVVAVLVLRWLVVGRLANMTARSTRRRLQLAVALMAVSGVVHGLSLLFFPNLPVFEQAVHTILLVGLSAGCVATASGYWPIYLAYTIPTLGPLAIIWAVSPTLRDSGWLPGLMSLIMVLFAAAFYMFTRDTNRLIRESFKIRLELAEVNQQLEGALELARTANQAKTRFLASASHDLRQPIQTIALFAAALALRPLDARSKRITDSMNDAMRDLNGELDELLDVSKLDAGMVETQPEPILMRPFLERICGFFRLSIANDKVRLELACPEEAAVRADKSQLERIVRNLIENAIKYTTAGYVQVTVLQHADGYKLAIEDTGCGIPAGEQQRVFEEFYQINNPERNRRKGIGLGLSIVKRLAQLQGIGLSLESKVGEGTRVTLSLPPAVEFASKQALPPVRRATQVPLHVLIVDDEESVRFALQVLFEELGWTVSAAATANEALEELRGRRPDVMLCDMRLRDGDGVDAIDAARSVLPDLPALIITGDTAPERLSKAVAAGVTVLHKPIDHSTLIDTINRMRVTDRAHAHA